MLGRDGGRSHAHSIALDVQRAGFHRQRGAPRYGHRSSSGKFLRVIPRASSASPERPSDNPPSRLGHLGWESWSRARHRPSHRVPRVGEGPLIRAHLSNERATTDRLRSETQIVGGSLSVDRRHLGPRTASEAGTCGLGIDEFVLDTHRISGVEPKWPAQCGIRSAHVGVILILEESPSISGIGHPLLRGLSATASSLTRLNDCGAAPIVL